MKKFILISTTFIIILLSSLVNLNTSWVNVSADNSSSEIIMEVSTGRILHESNAYSKKYMASTTKILTAICVIENCDLEKIITVTAKTVGVEGSSIYLEEGERLSVKDLLYGLMLRSGNDCAETLACHCSGDIKTFANLMNDTAKRIGALNSNFVNPHGLPDDNHYTTAYDLALISCYAMKNPVFKEIVSTKSIKIPFTTRDYDRLLINKNKLLKDFEGANGIKTGYTKKAGRCFVGSCVRDGMELVCVLLNCPPMFERSKELLNEKFEQYKMFKLFESDHIIDFVKVVDSDKTCGVYIKSDITVPLTENEHENLNIVYGYPKIIEKNTKKDSEVGTIKIYYKNNLLFQEKVYTINNIE